MSLKGKGIPISNRNKNAPAAPGFASNTIRNGL
jgi:hypothetical protein